jgi:hypothetical protein
MMQPMRQYSGCTDAITSVLCLFQSMTQKSQAGLLLVLPGSHNLERTWKCGGRKHIKLQTHTNFKLPLDSPFAAFTEVHLSLVVFGHHLHKLPGKDRVLREQCSMSRPPEVMAEEVHNCCRTPSPTTHSLLYNSTGIGIKRPNAGPNLVLCLWKNPLPFTKHSFHTCLTAVLNSHRNCEAKQENLWDSQSLAPIWTRSIFLVWPLAVLLTHNACQRASSFYPNQSPQLLFIHWYILAIAFNA